MGIKLDSSATAKGKCELMAEAQARFKEQHGDQNVIGTTEAWIVNYGREFTFRPRPQWCPRMTPKLCFFNSMTLVVSEEGREHGLSYCEGFVTDPKCPLNIHHAWTVDDDGIIVDPTIPEAMWDPDTVSYFGVNIPDLDLLTGFFLKPDRGCLIDHPNGRELIETYYEEVDS